ncbi:hypothetical protein M9Y10_040045 [Tritrichomonas musculus]|uniref:alpha-L-rhamnosidase n=1 Tax=Tritrichomonas musculus TaxID=1915356 RepID=A0ABR2GR51_9EUKA
MASQITKLRVNGVYNPIGYDTSSLSFSWLVEGTKAKSQKSARVIISTDPSCDPSKKDHLIHDSGVSAEISSLEYNPNFDTKTVLHPRTRYYWKVQVETDLNEKLESPVSFFETSKLNELWTAKWIATEKVGKITPPYVRKEFNLSKKVKEARAYMTGFGLFELYVNGKRPTEEYFIPGNTNYRLWVQYHTFDITNLLRENKNAIGVLIGDGWARGRVGYDMPSADFTRKTDYRGVPVDYATDRYELICEVHVTYEDGTTEVINSDGTWKCHKSNILMNDIYDGEIQDANLVIPGWNEPGLDDKDWFECNEINEPLHEKLTPRFGLPVVVKERRKPKEIFTDPAGNRVIDMGQNMTGWIEMKIHAPKGFEVIVEHGEILQEGIFFRDNIRSALQQFRYISDGKELVVHSHFTYHGFRYARLVQWEGPVNIEDFVGCNVYSDLDMVGHLETGVPIVNKFISSGFWSQRDNFLDVPTDCPQRDERLGWTADAQIFSETAMFNMNCYAFYRKYLKDILLQQIRDGGIPPLWCPQFLALKDILFFPTDGMIAWSDVATVIPWNVYLMNGKKQILQDYFEAMTMWVEVMYKHIKDGLWDITYMQLCDWLALYGPDIPENHSRVIGGTENTFQCSAYYYYSLNLVCKAAKVLGNNEAYEKYHKRAEETLKAIRDEYFTPTGRCAIQTQTALSLAIILDLYPEGTLQTSANSLHKLLENKNFHLCTGFIGTPILCRALAKCGRNEDGVTTFLQEDYPGWLYPITMGATTTWERWDSMRQNGKVSPEGMNSFNHYAYASVLEWIYCDICGLNPLTEYPGFKRALFKPHPDERLHYAKASHESPNGLYTCEWKIEGDKVHYSFSIPYNAQAKLELVDLKKGEVFSSTCEVTEQGNNVVSDFLPSGKYEIVYKYKKSDYKLPNKFK